MAETEPIRFNVNHNVRVKLTERGIEILRAAHEKYHAMFPEIFGGFVPPKTDDEGWSTWQLWSLMAEIGPHMAMGAPVPFETEIEILLPVADPDHA